MCSDSEGKAPTTIIRCFINMNAYVHGKNKMFIKKEPSTINKHIRNFSCLIILWRRGRKEDTECDHKNYYYISSIKINFAVIFVTSFCVFFLLLVCIRLLQIHLLESIM